MQLYTLKHKQKYNQSFVYYQNLYTHLPSGRTLNNKIIIFTHDKIMVKTLKSYVHSITDACSVDYIHVGGISRTFDSKHKSHYSSFLMID